MCWSSASGEQLEDHAARLKLIAEQRRGVGGFAVEPGRPIDIIHRKCAVIVVRAIGTDGAKTEAGSPGACLAECIAAAHICASVVVAHLKAGEIFDVGRAVGRSRVGQRVQAAAEEQKPSGPACASPNREALDVTRHGAIPPAASRRLCCILGARPI
jgi:hypothetical protein